MDFEDSTLEVMVLQHFQKKDIPAINKHQIQINIKGEFKLSKLKK